MTTTTINIQTDSLRKVGAHLLRSGLHSDRKHRESDFSELLILTTLCLAKYWRNGSLSLQLTWKELLCFVPLLLVNSCSMWKCQVESKTRTLVYCLTVTL